MAVATRNCFAAGVVALVGVCTTSAQADLYTETLFSIEWLADSCDVIFVGEESEPHASPTLGTRYQAVRFLKGVDHQVPWLTTRREPDADPIDERWLVFARRDRHGVWHVIQKIDLVRPRWLYSTAAMTADGEVLKDKATILGHVTQRLVQRRSLPDLCDPFAVDAKGKTYSLSGRFQRRPLIREINRYLGGFTVPVDCHLWDFADEDDAEEVRDDDTWIFGVVAPADEQYRDKTVQVARDILNGQKEKPGARLRKKVLRLVNYRDPEVVELLTEIKQRWIGNAIRPGEAPPTNLQRDVAREAERVLHYWKVLDSRSDPLSQQIVGRWRAPIPLNRGAGPNRRPRRWFELELDQSFRFRITGWEQAQDAKEPRLMSGRGRNSGYWFLDNGQLELQSNRSFFSFDDRSPHRVHWNLDASGQAPAVIATIFVRFGRPSIEVRANRLSSRIEPDFPAAIPAD